MKLFRKEPNLATSAQNVVAQIEQLRNFRVKKLFLLVATLVLLAGSTPARAQVIGRHINAPSTAVGDALTPFYNAALTTGATVKSSAGNLYGWDIYNPNASVCFLQVFNATQANVTLGTTAPLFSIEVGATS